MGMLQTTHGPLRDEETQQAGLIEAKKKMDRFYTLVVHGMDDFKQDGADLQEYAPSLKKYTKPEEITETEWEQLEERQHRLHQESRQAAQAFGNIKRAFSQAQKSAEAVFLGHGTEQDAAVDEADRSRERQALFGLHENGPGRTAVLGYGPKEPPDLKE